MSADTMSLARQADAGGDPSSATDAVEVSIEPRENGLEEGVLDQSDDGLRGAGLRIADVATDVVFVAISSRGVFSRSLSTPPTRPS